MADLGSPSILISFHEKSRSVIQRGERGIVLLLVECAALNDKKNPMTITDEFDIPEALPDVVKEQIKLAMMGYVTKPKKVVVYCLGDLAAEQENSSEAVTNAYQTALKNVETVKFNYMAVPSVIARNMSDTIANWVEKMRKDTKMIHAVLPNKDAGNEGIINYATNKVTRTESISNLDGTVSSFDTEYTAEQYCSRIAGMIAGTPINMSCTYAVLPELTACEAQEDNAKAVNEGKFVLMSDGEKIKTCRAVNSFLTLTPDKGDSFKKIKIVEAMDMITDDITTVIQDSYIGKYPNNYANKQVLMAAISEYFKGLQLDGVVSSYEIALDSVEIKKYLQNRLTEDEIAEMSEADIKKADTGSKIFLIGKVGILDAIEDVVLPINI
ncbi:MAG: phage tail sheath subtilisin-like domain-containing protein [Lachnoclostridium sp.]|jgi:hypothetical protein|nr:phage tail sheath subtilisin-like domain-containing protein [Lachnoclostridium sp.]